MTQEELEESKCTRKWNSVRKSFANFTNRKYNIRPVYDYSNNKTKKNTTTNSINSSKTGGVTRKHQEVKKKYWYALLQMRP